MKDFNLNDIEPLYINRPHLVIIGAGATLDTIPDGDKNKNKSPVMKGFFKELGLEYLLEDINLHTTSDNLEAIYSELYDRGDECKTVRENLENKIWNHYNKLELPDSPTKYDMLVLSLTKKDCIASFNWDPLLMQAYNRVKNYTDNLPEMLFLHGNVWAGYCEKCKLYGPTKRNCPKCNKPFTNSPLLYPVTHKDYSSNIFIKDQWNVFRYYLSKAAILTIYGYGAPKTDVDTIEIMKSAFSCYPDLHIFDSMEIIDKPGSDHDQLYDTWTYFIDKVKNHVSIYDSIYESTIANIPRRSVEVQFYSSMKGNWDAASSIKFDGTESWDDIESKISPFIRDEVSNKKGKLNMI
jgi:hypothetical protein